MTRVALILLYIFASNGFTFAKDEGLCGRKADMVEVMIEMQKPTVQSVWRDHKLFVNKDSSDGSLWAISMNNTTVHPSVVCRRRTGAGDTSKLEIGFLCSANEKACNSFKLQALERMDKVEKDIN